MALKKIGPNKVNRATRNRQLFEEGRRNAAAKRKEEAEALDRVASLLREQAAIARDEGREGAARALEERAAIRDARAEGRRNPGVLKDR